MRPVSAARCFATTWSHWRDYKATAAAVDGFDDFRRRPVPEKRLFRVQNKCVRKFLKNRHGSERAENFAENFFAVFTPFLNRN